MQGNEWVIVTVIIALVGLFIAIATPLVKLIKAITTLTCATDGLRLQMEKQETDNRRSHDRLWDKNREQDATLDDHETRIHTMECNNHDDRPRRK